MRQIAVDGGTRRMRHEMALPAWRSERLKSDPRQPWGRAYSPNEKMRFQSFFMLTMNQPSFFAWS